MANTPHVHLITLFHHQFWGVLYPDVRTERPFTRPLESRTIDTIDAEVVLPSDVVGTFGIHLSFYKRLERRRLSLFNGEDRLTP